MFTGLGEQITHRTTLKWYKSSGTELEKENWNANLTPLLMRAVKKGRKRKFR